MLPHVVTLHLQHDLNLGVGVYWFSRVTGDTLLRAAKVKTTNSQKEEKEKLLTKR